MKYFQKEYIKLMRKRWAVYDSILGLKDSEQRILKRINREYGKKGIKKLNKTSSLKGKRVLDVGSSCGEFIIEAVNHGAVGYGVEPDELSIEISKLLFKIFNKKATLKKAYAEKIPFENNFFDVVISNSTIEHVNNPKKTLDEMIRVLKPNGILWLKCPNFLYPFERHYKRFYFPFLPKIIEQLYFNILSKRWTKYFLHLNRITPYFIIRYLKNNNLKFNNLSSKQGGNYFQKILSKLHIYPQIEFLIKK